MNPFSTKVIKNAANQSVRPYSTNQKYLFAMREDLAEWLKGLYGIDINAENFFDILETGILLCKHANNMTSCAKFMKSNDLKVQILPSASLTFNEGKHVQARSFFARDNIASFLGYCSEQLQIPDIVRFETNDLVLRLNEKNVILCLLEVARKGSKFGVPAPILVQMEEDIDAEIELDNAQECEAEPIAPPRPQKKRVNCDFKSLDEMVQSVLQLCTCPNQFPMVRVGDGKYKVGNSKNLIFMRILRQHVMVRVGGGWDTLEHYLNKHDPCRCHKHRTEKNLSPRIRSSSVCSVNKPRKSTVEIKLSPPTSNVFQRLSQPRMSPPVASTASSGDPVFQDDMLIVERNQRGATEVSHRVQRLSESSAKSSPTERNSPSFNPPAFASDTLQQRGRVNSFNDVRKSNHRNSTIDFATSPRISLTPTPRRRFTTIDKNFVRSSSVEVPAALDVPQRRPRVNSHSDNFGKSACQNTKASKEMIKKPKLKRNEEENHLINAIEIRNYLKDILDPKQELEILKLLEEECERNQHYMQSKMNWNKVPYSCDDFEALQNLVTGSAS